MNKRLLPSLLVLLASGVSAQTTVIRAGRLIDPETGRAAMNQMIVVQGDKITAVGADLAVPKDATVIDLSNQTVLPGLVDAHTHLGLTYKDIPENNYYYLTYVMESTPLRAIEAASNGIQLLNSGFTVVRDLGNNALYTDTAHRTAIEQGWIPGPTIINSGLIIGGMGGQFWPTPEMAKQHNIVYPEYMDADTHDEIVKAVRENMLFGSKIIKICVDCKPWGYTVDEMKLFISEAAKGGLKVAGHVQTPEGRHARDRGGALVDRARHGAFRRAPEADGEERHLPGVHRYALHVLLGFEGSVRGDRGQAEGRLEERGEDHFLNRHGLLEDGERHDPRRADHQLPPHLEGGRHPQRGHPEGHDHHRLRVRPG